MCAAILRVCWFHAAFLCSQRFNGNPVEFSNMSNHLARSDTVVDEAVSSMMNQGADTHAMFDLAGASVNPVVAKLIPDHPDSETEGFSSIDLCEGAGKGEGVEGEEVFVIGRSKEISTDYRVDHPRLSNKHCKLILEHATSKVFAVDISTNGTFINDVRVAKGERVLLSAADSIKFVNDKAFPETANATHGGPKVCTSFIFQQVKRTGTASGTMAPIVAVTSATGDTMNVAGVAVRKIQAAAVPKDPSAPVGLSDMEDDLTCSITLSLLYNPFMVLPCLHCFSAHAISRWIDEGKRNCPECRGVISQVRPSHKVSNLLTKFIEQHKNTPGFQYYTDDEMAAMNAENKIPSTGKAFKRAHEDDDEFDDEDMEDDEEYSDDSDQYVAQNNGGGWNSVGITSGFGGGAGWGGFHNHPNFHTNNNCPQCQTPSPVDGYMCSGFSGPHHTCRSCHIRFPNRPLCDIPQTCFLCSQPYCDAYLSAIPMPGVAPTTTATSATAESNTADNDASPTASSSAPVPAASSTNVLIPGGACRNETGRKIFKMLKDHVVDELPASLFAGNTIEQSILSSYLSNQGSIPDGTAINFNSPLHVMQSFGAANPYSVANVWRLCCVNLENGTWIPEVVSIKGPVKATSYVCRPCCQRVFAAQLYHYRRAINPGSLPNSVANRPHCWHGAKCRTQFHNHQHAQKYNHVCPQEKRKE